MLHAIFIMQVPPYSSSPATLWFVVPDFGSPSLSAQPPPLGTVVFNAQLTVGPAIACTSSASSSSVEMPAAKAALLSGLLIAPASIRSDSSSSFHEPNIQASLVAIPVRREESRPSRPQIAGFHVEVCRCLSPSCLS